MMHIFNPASPQYSEWVAWLLIFKFITFWCLLVFSTILTILMLKRRSSVPQLVTIFFVSKTVIVTLLYLIASLSSETNRTILAAGSAGYIGLSACLTVAFVSYFSSSEVVKETFTQRLPKSFGSGVTLKMDTPKSDVV